MKDYRCIICGEKTALRKDGYIEGRIHEKCEFLIEWEMVISLLENIKDDAS